jgi:hypothetical protein
MLRQTQRVVFGEPMIFKGYYSRPIQYIKLGASIRALYESVVLLLNRHCAPYRGKLLRQLSNRG